MTISYFHPLLMESLCQFSENCLLELGGQARVGKNNQDDMLDGKDFSFREIEFQSKEVTQT